LISQRGSMSKTDILFISIGHYTGKDLHLA